MANVGNQVRAVYDFSGEPGSAELSIAVGEVLTLTRQDVGEGWWEGTNQHGQTGLFPEAYVEEVSSSEPPSMPPPPLPDGFSDWSGSDNQSQIHSQRSYAALSMRSGIGSGSGSGTGSDKQSQVHSQSSFDTHSIRCGSDIQSQAYSQRSSSNGSSTLMNSEVSSQRSAEGTSHRGSESSAHRSYESSSQRNQEAGAQRTYDDASNIHESSSKRYDSSKSHEVVKSYDGSPQEGGDYWEDDDWDDDIESNANFGSAGTPSAALSSYYPVSSSTTRTANTDDDSSLSRSDSRSVVGKKNFNRFSAFGKSGVENFLLSQAKVDVPDCEVIITVKQTGEGIIWDPITEPYSCVVASPKKESKLKGLKSFIAYQLTPSFNNIQVSRRYKHFDWLHERLQEKFCFVPIPPLPDKQISGRYEEQFIEHRRIQLQAFVDAMCRHPVLSQCSVWQHFITCTDEKRWKTGKRKEEKDKLLGVHYLFALQVPDHPLDAGYIEQEIEGFARFIHTMDGAIKSLLVTAADQTKKHQGPYKREYQKIGQAFTALGLSFEEAAPDNPRSLLTNAVKYTGDAYNFIGKLFEDQPKQDWEPLADVLHIYKGILSSFPDIITLYRTAIQKRKDCERFLAENRMDEYHVAEVKRRTDMISYAIMAEIQHFHSQRAEDYRACMKNYITEQINFYELIGNKLRDALVMYEGE